MMSRIKVLFLVTTFMFSLVISTAVVAGVNCSTPPECLATGVIGSLGGATAISPLGTSESGFTTIRFPASDYKIYVGSDITITDLTHKNWQYVYMGDAGLTSNVDVAFYGSILQIPGLVLEGSEARSVGISQLNLANVNLDTNTVSLNFQGSDNQINLTNSNIDFSDRDPVIKTGVPFAINALGGDSRFTGFTGRIVPSFTSINLQSGSTLEFFYSFSGELSNDTETNGLFFGAPVNGTVDDAALKFRLSNVYFNSSSFNFSNNSLLELSGTGTSVEFENLSINNSQANIGGGTSLKVSNKLILSDAAATNDTVTMGGGATVDADTVEVVGDAVISGDTDSSTVFSMNWLDISSNVSLDQNGVNTDIDGLYLNPGAVFNIDSGNAFVEKTYANVSTISLTNSATYSMTGGFAGLIGNSVDNALTLNIDATSRFNVGSRASMFVQSPNTVINNNGQFNIFGELTGFGAFSGSGEVIVKETGQISPGLSRFNDIGTLTFDNTLKFTNQGAQGDQSQSQYLAHIDIDAPGGTETNDLIEYNDNNVDTSGLTSIKVETATAKTADDLDGGTFTIVAAQSVTSSGTIIDGGNTPAVVGGGSIPALIDFSIFNNNTNGNIDITLLANKDIGNLAKNPLAATRNRQATSSLLVNANNSGNTVIPGALNTLTNAQVASHLDSLHAEPYSSYMTVSLEHTDMIMNTVQSRGIWGGAVSNRGSEEANQPGSSKRFWMDAAYLEGDVEGDGDLGDFDYTLTHFMVGHDLVDTGALSYGAYFSIGSQDMDEHDRLIQDFSGNSYHVGMYMSMADVAGWELRGVAGYGYGEHSSKRRVQLSGSSASPQADFNSHSLYAGIKGSFVSFQNDWVTLSPEVGLNYIHYMQDSFSESGDANLSLKVDAADAQAIVASAGVNARFARFTDTSPVYPLAFMRFEHDLYANSNSEHDVDAALVAQSGFKQTFVGQNRGENAIIAGLGVGSELSSALQIRGGILLSKDSNGSETGIGLNLEYTW